MDHDADELRNLELGEVLLPPDVALVLGPHGRYHVVQVHPHVHEGVQEPEEGAVAARRELETFQT